MHLKEWWVKNLKKRIKNNEEMTFYWIKNILEIIFEKLGKMIMQLLLFNLGEKMRLIPFSYSMIKYFTS